MSNAKQLAEALNCAQSVISDCLKAVGKVYKEGKWVPYELKLRDIERRKTICEILLARQQRKGFLHRIVTGDEKWFYFDNLKRRKIICHIQAYQAIDIDAKAEYPRKEGNALYLVESEGV